MLIYHVGTMKSGTTYLQSILQKNKSQLLQNGWRYPGKRLNHQHAVYDLVPNSVPWGIPASGRRDGKLASGLATQIQKNKKHSIILSAEVLSCLDEEGIKQVVNTFGKPDKVIFTIRNLSKVIPSAWQQYIKGGGKLSLDKFVSKMESDRSNLDGMWKIYAYGNQIKLWSKFAPVSSVVVPDSGAKESLADLFFSVLNLNSDKIDFRVKSTDTNLSLGYEIAEILRYLNARHNLTEVDRNFFLKQIVFPKLGKLSSTKIKISKKQQAKAADWASEENELVHKFSENIIGDINALILDSNIEDSRVVYDQFFPIASELMNDLLNRLDTKELR